jgi:hypothetical protein
MSACERFSQHPTPDISLRRINNVYEAQKRSRRITRYELELVRRTINYALSGFCCYCGLPINAGAWTLDVANPAPPAQMMLLNRLVVCHRRCIRLEIQGAKDLSVRDNVALTHRQRVQRKCSPFMRDVDYCNQSIGDFAKHHTDRRIRGRGCTLMDDLAETSAGE